MGLALAIGLAASDGSAMWAKMSTEELVSRSDLIVVGELGSLMKKDSGSVDVGTIKVEEVILGRNDLTEVFLVVPGSERTLKSSTDLVYTEGQRGVWFLRHLPALGEEYYVADHPQRLHSVDQVASVREIIMGQSSEER